MRDDCKHRMNGNHRDAIERVVERLHVVLAPTRRLKGCLHQPS